MSDKRECDKRDPVGRMVRDSTAEEFTEWLVKYHGLDADSANTVISNLREAFKWHRLQGRVDRSGAAMIVAELLQMRRSTATLETPKKPEAA